MPASPVKILVLFAHPAYQKSRINRRMVEGLRGLDGIEVVDLYERYPHFNIDVRGEQHRLQAHDLIVFQHPLYWYSTPALLKEWQDLVLEHGFAYGVEGDALRGKHLLSAITTGGSREAYTPEGLNRYPIAELLRPFDQTAHLCGMTYLPPFVVHGTHRITEPERFDAVAEDYRRLLLALRDGHIPESDLARVTYLNECLDFLDDGTPKSET